VPASTGIGRLAFALEREAPLDRYVIGFVADALGLRAVETDATASRPLLYYGNEPPEGLRGIVIPRHPGDVLWRELLDGALDPAAIGPRLSFDLISAIGALLTDAVNAGRPRDRHGRLPFAASFQAEQMLGEEPLVDRYLGALRVVIRRELGAKVRPRWPEGKRAAIGLSHDVDRPYKWGILRAIREGRHPPSIGALPRFAAKAAYTAVQRVRRPIDDFWLFERILEGEERHGFRSTFFFASMPAFGAWGSFEDVYYEIAWPRFGPVFASLRESGFGIGLHASYGAHRGLERLTFERDRLGQVAEVEPRGVRHHLWHLGPDEPAALRLHERAGFAFDASLAFNDHLGFRRNVALPFRPWDPLENRPLRTLQLPTFCMDGTLFYGGSSVADAIQQVERYLAAIKAVGGFGSIDWHVRSSIPANREFRPWGEAYLAILARLAADPQLWVTSLDEVAAWVESRA
jgi:hypothetical protein